MKDNKLCETFLLRMGVAVLLLLTSDMTSDMQLLRTEPLPSTFSAV